MSEDKIDRILEEQHRFERTREILRHSLSIAVDQRVTEESMSHLPQRYPRWPSGVRKIDDHFGGFYGLTMIGGNEATGKSLLALGSSLLAAETGWCVCYFDAENGQRIMRDRYDRWYGETLASEARQRLQGYWHRFRVRPGATTANLLEQILHAYTLRHHGLLIVLDSHSTIAEFGAESSQDSLDLSRRMLFWLDSLVQGTHGYVSALSLSELNAGGELKGLKAKYTASVAVRLEKEDDDALVRIKITKSRDGRSGDAGLHTREWRTGRFVETTDVTK